MTLMVDAPQLQARSATRLEAGRTTSISLGKVNGRRFCFSAGIGFDAEAVRRIDSRGRDRDGRRAGNLTFTVTVFGILFAKRLQMPAQLEIDDFGRAAFVFVANGRPYTYMGAVPVNVAGRADFAGRTRLSFAPRERHPRVDAAAVRASPRLPGATRPRFPGVLTGHDLDAFRVRCDVATPLQADGEDLGDVTEASFSAERDALAVLV